jgi:hypothetical protein
MGEWTSFFQSSAGASATLIGLVVVAISINLTRILAHPRLPARAAAALTPLAGVLVVTLLGLVPSQPLFLYGAEALVVGAIMWVSGLTTTMWARSQPALVTTLQFWSNFGLNQAQSLPFVIAGALLLLHQPAGLYWIAPGVIFSLLAGVLNTWVLLIEILR